MNEFAIISWAHLIAAIIGAISAILLYKLTFKYGHKVYGYAILILFIENFLNLLRQFPERGFVGNLPLHLCTICLLLTGITIVLDKREFFPFLVFTSFGAILAILTPVDEGVAGVSIATFNFYITHSTSLVGIYVMHHKMGYRIIKNDWIRALVYVIAMGAFMLGFNYIFNTNFFYVSEPIQNPIVNLLGPWPQYLVGFAIIALVVFFTIEKIYIKIFDNE